MNKGVQAVVEKRRLLRTPAGDAEMLTLGCCWPGGFVLLAWTVPAGRLGDLDRDLCHAALREQAAAQLPPRR